MKMAFMHHLTLYFLFTKIVVYVLHIIKAEFLYNRMYRTLFKFMILWILKVNPV